MKVGFTDVVYDTSYRAWPSIPMFPRGLDIYSLECYYDMAFCRRYFTNLQAVFSGEIFATIQNFGPYGGFDWVGDQFLYNGTTTITKFSTDW